jgi:hypothetical protein
MRIKQPDSHSGKDPLQSFDKNLKISSSFYYSILTHGRNQHCLRRYTLGRGTYLGPQMQRAQII